MLAEEPDEIVTHDNADGRPTTAYVDPAALVDKHVMKKGKWNGQDHWVCDCGFDTLHEPSAEEHKRDYQKR